MREKPVDRLISWYNHKVVRDNRFNEADIPFADYANLGDKRFYDPLITGKYADVINETILPFFPLENCHFILQEKLESNYANEIEKVLDFLGVSLELPAFEKRNISENTLNVNDALRKELKLYYHESNIKFSKLTGISVDNWA